MTLLWYFLGRFSPRMAFFLSLSLTHICFFSLLQLCCCHSLSSPVVGSLLLFPLEMDAKVSFTCILTKYCKGAYPPTSAVASLSVRSNLSRFKELVLVSEMSTTTKKKKSPGWMDSVKRMRSQSCFCSS